MKMDARISPCLMFEGNAEAAMDFYVSLFDDSAVETLERWTTGELGEEGLSSSPSFVCLVR